MERALQRKLSHALNEDVRRKILKKAAKNKRRLQRKAQKENSKRESHRLRPRSTQREVEYWKRKYCRLETKLNHTAVDNWLTKIELPQVGKSDPLKEVPQALRPGYKLQSLKQLFNSEPVLISNQKPIYLDIL